MLSSIPLRRSGRLRVMLSSIPLRRSVDKIIGSPRFESNVIFDTS